MWWGSHPARLNAPLLPTAGHHEARLCALRLLDAAAAGDAGMLRRLLRQHEADLECLDLGGRTPLHVACRAGHVDVTRLLLSARASCDQPSRRGVTPLVAACQAGHEACVALLCEAGAAAAGRGPARLAALDAAERTGHEGCTRLVEVAAASDDAPMPTSRCATLAWARLARRLGVAFGLESALGSVDTALASALVVVDRAVDRAHSAARYARLAAIDDPEASYVLHELTRGHDSSVESHGEQRGGGSPPAAAPAADPTGSHLATDDARTEAMQAIVSAVPGPDASDLAAKMSKWQDVSLDGPHQSCPRPRAACDRLEGCESPRLATPLT